MTSTASGPATTGDSRCVHKSLLERGEMSLPVLADHGPRGTIRQSRSGKRRAIVLAVVQGLIILHIVLWYSGAFGGRTTTPIEPSESMEFVKSGIINAGLVFFLLALLSTMILGRWFCGWGCHIVLLQDLCGWMMKKCGVRPKPFRSRLLMLVPLLLALYMFIWPAVHRWGLLPLDLWMTQQWGADHWAVSSIRSSFGFFGVPLGQALTTWQARTELVGDDFWATFPGVMMAVPFLLVCGFATVYFLGAKGFCTYGCPYGGFFAPLDKFAAGRIRVTDDCEQCGHCTAVCTSNVRVHDEVREYGMVVDPGCMKCLDCVSVCPNDALYYGFGRPSLARGEPKHAAPPRKFDLTWAEEIGLAVVFVVAFFSLRGSVVSLPLLFAAGAAGVATFLVFKLWRLVRDENVNLHRHRLKYRGSWQTSGLVFGFLAVLTAGLLVHSAAVNLVYVAADHHDRQVTTPPQLVFGAAVQMEPQMRGHAEAARSLYRLTLPISQGGLSLGMDIPREIDVRTRIAWLNMTLRDFAAAETVLKQGVELAEQRLGADDLTRVEDLYSILAQVIRSHRGFRAGIEFYESILSAHPELESMLSDYVRWLTTLGLLERDPAVWARAEHFVRRSIEALSDDQAAQRMSGHQREQILQVRYRILALVHQHTRPREETIEFSEHVLAEHTHWGDFAFDYIDWLQNAAQASSDQIINAARRAASDNPEHLQLMRQYSLILLNFGDIKQGVDLVRKTLEIDPYNANAMLFLALGEQMLGNEPAMERALRRGLQFAPRHPQIAGTLCQVLLNQGRTDEAAPFCDIARQAGQGIEPGAVIQN